MAASASTQTVELPWLEKYRPKDFRDVVGNDETLSRLAVISEQGNMPNIIITVRPPSPHLPLYSSLPTFSFLIQLPYLLLGSRN